MAIPSNIVPFVKPQRHDDVNDVQGPIEEADGGREGRGAKPADRAWIIVLLILLFGGFALIFGGGGDPAPEPPALPCRHAREWGLLRLASAWP